MKYDRNALARADSVALAATKAAFHRWCEERAEALCEAFEEAFTWHFCAEAALRQAKRCSHLYSAEDLAFWKNKQEGTEIEMLGVAYEIGVLAFPYFLPMRLRRWRESQKEIK